MVWKTLVSVTRVALGGDSGLSLFCFPLAPLTPTTCEQSFSAPSSQLKTKGCLFSFFYCLVKKQMQCFLPISLLDGGGGRAWCSCELHHSSVCRSNWKEMIQVIVITHILFFSSSAASAPHLSCVGTSWSSTFRSVVVHINNPELHSLSLILVFHGGSLRFCSRTNAL